MWFSVARMLCRPLVVRRGRSLVRGFGNSLTVALFLLSRSCVFSQELSLMRQEQLSGFQNVWFEFNEINHFQEGVVPTTDSYSDMLTICNGRIPTICCRPELGLKSGLLWGSRVQLQNKTTTNPKVTSQTKKAKQTKTPSTVCHRLLMTTTFSQ